MFLSIFTCCLAFSVLSFGVYATLTNIQFKLSGCIQFTIPVSYFASDWKTRLTDSKVILNVNKIASIKFLDSQPAEYVNKVDDTFATNNQYILDENGKKVNDTSK